jgi:hypothetical protein
VTTQVAAGVAALTLDEVTRAVKATASSSWGLDRGVLESSDPRDAAAIAAWRALVGQLDPGPPRVFVSEAAGGAPEAEASSAFAREVAAARADRTKPSIEVRQTTELGQGEVWMLLASPCATVTESSQTAGLAALTVRALARAFPEVAGVHLEPWVSPNGVGLLAHGPRNRPTESPAEHAARVADVLGRVFASARPSDESVAGARLQLQSELGQETELLWPVAIEALSPQHPSLLDPRGTWQSVTELPAPAVGVERRALVRGPLRLALLLSATPDSADGARVALERWLRPERTRSTTCPTAGSVASKPAEYEIDPPTQSSGGARALVAVSIPVPAAGGVPIEAEWTAHLLNRQNGWLDRSVRVPGLAVHAEAAVLGGHDTAALAVEIVSTGDKAREAASQARAVFARLAEGAATPDDLVAARSAFEAERTAASVDPRHRVVQLWLGNNGSGSLPDLAALRRFHREVLAPERHVVVLPRAR